MINMLGGEQGAVRSFSPYHFDLVIVDEAHRTIYRRYSRIFDYFDSLLLGLTATPRQEVDHNTYAMFHLEDGSPTADYPLDQAIDDGYLVPFKSFQCSSVILREGVVYANLSPEEQLEWENQNWGFDENGEPIEAPEEANADEINAQAVQQRHHQAGCGTSTEARHQSCWCRSDWQDYLFHPQQKTRRTGL
jgi:hypothetical protein